MIYFPFIVDCISFIPITCLSPTSVYKNISILYCSYIFLSDLVLLKLLFIISFFPSTKFNICFLSVFPPKKCRLQFSSWRPTSDSRVLSVTASTIWFWERNQPQIGTLRYNIPPSVYQYSLHDIAQSCFSFFFLALRFPIFLRISSNSVLMWWK